MEIDQIPLNFLGFIHDLVADMPGSEGRERKVVKLQRADPGFRLPAGSLVVYEDARILLSDHWYLFRMAGRGLAVRKVARIDTATCLSSEMSANQWRLENAGGEIETAPQGTLCLGLVRFTIRPLERSPEEEQEMISLIALWSGQEEQE